MSAKVSPATVQCTNNGHHEDSDARHMAVTPQHSIVTVHPLDRGFLEPEAHVSVSPHTHTRAREPAAVKITRLVPEVTAPESAAPARGDRTQYERPGGYEVMGGSEEAHPWLSRPWPLRARTWRKEAGQGVRYS